MSIPTNSAISLLIAIGIGLLIGSERERRKGSGSQRGAAGVRTFAFAAFAGALSNYLRSEALLVVVAAGAVLFSALAYRRTAQKDPGLTTEFALLVTVLLGALAMQNSLLAAGLSVITQFFSQPGSVSIALSRTYYPNKKLTMRWCFLPPRW